MISRCKFKPPLSIKKCLELHVLLLFKEDEEGCGVHLCSSCGLCERGVRPWDDGMGGGSRSADGGGGEGGGRGV